MFAPNNMAKQWIFEQLQERFSTHPFRVLDLACGDGSPWFPFLQTHPQCQYFGFDHDKKRITRAKRQAVGLDHAHFEYGDAQKLADLEPVDVVTALSALEHVVHLEAFCQTVYHALKPGGLAFLNYDIGHFRSSNPKERLMVPVSQALAKVGVEGPYMKVVHDETLIELLKKQGFKIQSTRKNNIASLKKEMKGMPEPVLQAWSHFENQLNLLLPPEQLHPMMLSTTLGLEKPL
jgi:2-polyprenyl-3-methyl-5-hydroxy-6-metoxy-1,4-benzoquinol methylase